MVIANKIKDILSPYANSLTVDLPKCKENHLEIIFNESNEVSSAYCGKGPPLPFAASDVFQANISHWRRLTAVDEDCKAVYEISLNITGSSFSFKPGDTIGIIPQNYNLEVNEIISHLGLSLQADLEYNLNVNKQQKGGKVPPHIPNKSTLRYVLTHCCDIRSVLKKLFILALSKYTKDNNERHILEYLCSKEGSSAYNTHILDQHFCILDLFSNFKSCKPPVEVLLANLPRLLPRPYSIVNSSLENSNVIKICFSVTELDNNRKGLVTGWMESILLKCDIEEKFKYLSIEEKSCKETVPIYMRRNISGFSVPEDLESPMILIGPGTGVSPYIGFLEERQYLKKTHPDTQMGEIWLYFGCRNPKLDFIYEDELNLFLNNGIIENLSTSFSRAVNSETKYVQDAMLKNGEDIVRLIHEGAAIFICGDLNNMAVQVKETLVSCLIKHGGKSRQEAETLLSDLQTGRRYLVDAWS